LARTRSWRWPGTIAFALLIAGCRSGPAVEVAPSRAIVVCGERIPTDANVVPWTDPPGYDASRSGPDGKLGYQPGRAIKLAGGGVATLIEPDSSDREALERLIDLFVLHYDACGTSQSCFRVLRERGLSVHFLLDVDGTIYQTLDLRDQAWHATAANPRSIGIEIANVGAFAPGKSALDAWYESDPGGTRVTPAKLEGQGVRTSGFVARPARPERIRGEIQGATYEQYDFTPEQYESLVTLTVTLCRTFPALKPEAPRDARGRVRSDALDADELVSFHGILGHEHVARRKIDPGPAFDWERFLADVRARLAANVAP
jgi:N-acetylmuramoyl-L-alanine amidase